MHQAPKVAGREFRMADHIHELESKGLILRPPELAAEVAAKKPPPGVPKKVGDALIYPARHFA